jgi:hypothetical protein
MRLKIRWLIADLLNRLPGQCWGDLVTWALETPSARKRRGNARHPWRPVTRICRNDLAQSRDGACYCGKLRRQP